MNVDTREEALEKLSVAAKSLWHRPCTNVEHNDVRCMTQFENQPTIPFSKWDVTKMCRECAAYWHVACAENLLREEIRIHEMRDAEEGR